VSYLAVLEVEKKPNGLAANKKQNEA